MSIMSRGRKSARSPSIGSEGTYGDSERPPRPKSHESCDNESSLSVALVPLSSAEIDIVFFSGLDLVAVANSSAFKIELARKFFA